MPNYVRKNLFESASFRIKFLKLYKKLGGVDKACRALDITTSQLYEYRKKGRNPDLKFHKNRRFVAKMNSIKESIVAEKKKKQQLRISKG